MSFLSSCIFCSIIQKNIPANIILENELAVVFSDINPIAPTHLLIIPKVHIESISHIKEEHSSYLSAIFFATSFLATKLQVKENSYRLVFNTNKLAGQTVFHIHGHFLANREFSWPPG